MRRPAFIAEQARHASGPLGRLIAYIMARETWSQNQRAIAALEVVNDDNVLDIGCGHGRSLPALSHLTPDGLVVGVDPSELMVEIAAKRAGQLIEACRADVVHAAVENLPFVAESFDKALCVHVLYFWPDLHEAFNEIARVLKPGGRLSLLFRTDDCAAAASFPVEIYRFRSCGDVATVLTKVGFGVETVTDIGDCILLTARRAA
jgi:ubiquinone/menaquinone biosynthesis C-methylase UbiE